MPNPARLIIARAYGNSIATLNLDTHEELFISPDELQNLADDCYGWDAQAFALGQCFQATMTDANYQTWADAYPRQTAPAYIWLTLCSEAGDSIGSLCLTDRREVIAPADEKSYLIGDCTPFSTASFDQGFSCVARMSAENWELWLEQFEVADLPRDTAALFA